MTAACKRLGSTARVKETAGTWTSGTTGQAAFEASRFWAELNN